MAGAKKSSNVTVTVSTFAITIMAIILAILFVPALQIGKQIQAQCHINGFGAGSCQFTNTGWTPGSQCIDVHLSNKFGGMVRSGAVCSGRVWPDDTSQRDISMAVGETCESEGQQWNAVCTMDVVNISGDGDDVQTQPSVISPRRPEPAPNESSQTIPSAAAPSPSPTESLPSTYAGGELKRVIDNTGGPSFDCSAHLTPTERAICGNTELRSLDRRMAILYYSNSSYATDPSYKDSQRAWLRSRNETCEGDEVCLLGFINTRIEILQRPNPN